MKLLTYLQKTKGITRREFEQMLRQKVILINEQPVDSFGYEIKTGDKMKILLPDGEVYEEIVNTSSKFKPIIVVFHKPKGYVVSKSDKYNKTIFEILPQSWKKDMYYIGRLDKDSRGLLLLTNVPELVDRFENPKNKVFKIYEVKIDKPLKTKDLARLKKGITSGDDQQILRFHDIHKIEGNPTFLRILLTEGKKRHIRRALKELGYKVKDLKRIKMGKYELGNIKEGKYQIIKFKRDKKKTKN